mmetsp:Transcript_129948/g.277506  ORF Transcript_129948/g.277506 Transcript_129948/m.277506 type:complete len:244 (-) Transcript_129948:141-872(-)
MIRRHNAAAVLFCAVQLLAATLATLAGESDFSLSDSIAVGPPFEAQVEETPVWTGDEKEVDEAPEVPAVVPRPQEAALGRSVVGGSPVAADGDFQVDDEEEIALASLPLQLETQIARTSEVAQHVAKEVQDLSQELSRLQRSFEPAARRHQQPASLLRLRSRITRSTAKDLDSLFLVEEDNSTGVNASNVGEEETEAVKKDFLYYFTLGGKISEGWSIVYWVAVVFVFIGFLCFCGCIGFRRA